MPDTVVFRDRPQTVHREFIADFWREFGRDGHKEFVSSKGSKATLAALRRLGRVKIVYKNGQDLSTRRENFNDIKGKRHQMRSHRHCFACRSITPDPVRHHIIWLKHGGINSKRNIVTLCRPCHAEIHPWLKGTITPDRSSYVVHVSAVSASQPDTTNETD